MLNYGTLDPKNGKLEQLFLKLFGVSLVSFLKKFVKQVG